MDNITCLICHKEIPDSDVVYGDMGNFYCANCFDNTPPEKPKLNRNQLFSENKRELYIDRKKWANKSKQSLANIVNKYRRGYPQAPELSQSQKDE